MTFDSSVINCFQYKFAATVVEPHSYILVKSMLLMQQWKIQQNMLQTTLEGRYLVEYTDQGQV